MPLHCVLYYSFIGEYPFQGIKIQFNKINRLIEIPSMLFPRNNLLCVYTSFAENIYDPRILYSSRGVLQ